MMMNGIRQQVEVEIASTVHPDDNKYSRELCEINNNWNVVKWSIECNIPTDTVYANLLPWYFYTVIIK